MAATLAASRYEDLLADTQLMGAKVAVVCGDRLVCYQRDDFAHIPDPGRWDLPGGIREPGESVLDCALREVREEFGITLPRGALEHAARYSKYEPQRIQAVFLAARVMQTLIDGIVFGDEGQRWQMMPVADFVDHPHAVRELQACVAAWWDGAI